MKPILHLSLLTAFTLSACAARQPEPPAAAEQAALAPQPAQAQAESEPQQPQRPAPPRIVTPATTPTGAWYSRRVVRVYHGSNEDMHELVAAELHSPQVLQQVVQACALPSDATKYIAIEMADQGSRTDIEVTVDLSRAPAGTPMAAREIADALVARLKQSVQTDVENPQDVLRARLEQNRLQMEQRLQQTTVQLAALREKIREQTGRSNATSERIREEVSELEQRHQQLQLELEARAARTAALSESIAKLTAQVEGQVKQDAAAAELEKVVQAREAQVERIRKLIETKDASEADLNEAMSRAAEARARLIERRSEAAERAGGGMVNEWNRELMNLSVDTAELQARIEKLGPRLERLQSVTSLLSDLDRLNALKADLQAYAKSMRHEAMEAERAVQSARRPRATVVRSEDRAGDRPGERRTGSRQSNTSSDEEP